MLKVNEKWKTNYPNAMKSWFINRGAICPIFKFSSDRKVIYITNAIENINNKLYSIIYFILILPHNRSQPT